jgi:hypothetical protein
MPLQNRVTPLGDLVAIESRGLLMGNRGVLHDGRRTIVRPWQVRRWIACRTEFRGRHRVVMQPRSYTELFFLDEATALSAGHRPCAECRREDYRRFRALWESCYGGPAGADDMDVRLHADRLDGRAKRTDVAEVSGLPDGTYVVVDGAALLVRGNELLTWSGDGYAERRTRPRHGDITVLTPRSIVGILAAGYQPDFHPSAATGIGAR